MRPIIALTLGCVLVPVLARAGVFTVTSLDDDDDVKIDGVCATTNEACTLRAAIEEAEHTSDEDVVVLPPGRFKLDRSLPAITKPLTIFGAGAKNSGTLVDGGGTFGIFDVRAPTTIEDLAIRGGRRNYGGAIRVSPADTETTLLVRNVQLTNNEASWSGGALFVDGHASVQLQRVTIARNTAAVGGGAIVIASGDATVSVLNATISDNTSGMDADVMNAGMLMLENVTLAGDVTDVQGGRVVAVRSILEPSPISGAVCESPSSIESLGDNLEDGTSCTLTPMEHGDPELKPLADIGGGILVRVIEPNSPAIDGSDSCPAAAEDQLGRPRPVDGDVATNPGPKCDIGAIEYDKMNMLTTTSTSTSTSSTTATGPTTTSTSTTTSTTSTTTCDFIPSFESVRVGLDGFRTKLLMPNKLPRFRRRLARNVGVAALHVQEAARDRGCSENEEQAILQLEAGAAGMTKVGATIRKKKGLRAFRAQAPELAAEADALSDEIRELEDSAP
jgi:hypothetical protein